MADARETALATVRATLEKSDLEWEEISEGLFMVELPGERKLKTPCRLDVGFLADPVRFLGRLAHDARRALLGLDLDLRCTLPRGVQHPHRLLAEEPGHRLVVELGWCALVRRGSGAQLMLECALAFLQTCELGRHGAQERTHLVGVEPLAGRGKRGLRDRGRRRRIGSR